MIEVTKSKVECICNCFSMKDYDEYLNGNISRNEMRCKYNCTDHILEKVFEKLGLISRQKHIQKGINNSIFDIINTEESAYLLGFYIADGYISNNRIGFSISKKDLEHLMKIKNILSKNSKIIFKKEITNKHGILSHEMCSLLVSNNHIFDKLTQYGFGNNKTYTNKSIKNIVPNEFMWHFIRGYFDGDGCISSSKVKHILKNKEYYSINVNWTIISHDKNILEEIQKFMQNDLNVNILLYQEKRGKNYLVGTHNKQNLALIYNKLYSNATLFLTRKHDKFKNIIANTEVSSEIS